MEKTKKYYEISLQTFMSWLAHFQQGRKRSARQIAVSMFDNAVQQGMRNIKYKSAQKMRDALATGTLDKSQFYRIRSRFRAQFRWYFADRQLDEENVWRDAAKIDRPQFHEWCSFILQDDDSVNIPVIPEYMAKKIDMLLNGEDGEYFQPRKEGVSRWRTLAPKLRVLVSLQNQWGNLHQMYSAAADDRSV